MKSEIKVYAKIKKNIITQIESEISSQYFDFEDTSIWTQIDEGLGEKYSHAQSNYFPIEKPLRDNQGRFNYKYIDSKVVELSDDEKEKLYPSKPVQPNEQELINAQLLKSNADTQLQLKNQILVNAELVKQIAELKGGNQ
ncbi:MULTISPECIES: hypothetical protein [unclassified Clostridium]|uniref:hypothetical protein n=1 Tax=unclassified Clostridium TaxID=2614128 RepID=UPI002079502B|nr:MULTISPECIES: hypothetical protein [unclassified Clostridium]